MVNLSNTFSETFYGCSDFYTLGSWAGAACAGLTADTFYGCSDFYTFGSEAGATSTGFTADGAGAFAGTGARACCVDNLITPLVGAASGLGGTDFLANLAKRSSTFDSGFGVFFFA